MEVIGSRIPSLKYVMGKDNSRSLHQENVKGPCLIIDETTLRNAQGYPDGE